MEAIVKKNIVIKDKNDMTIEEFIQWLQGWKRVCAKTSFGLFEISKEAVISRVKSKIEKASNKGQRFVIDIADFDEYTDFIVID